LGRDTCYKILEKGQTTEGIVDRGDKKLNELKAECGDEVYQSVSTRCQRYPAFTTLALSLIYNSYLNLVRSLSDQLLDVAHRKRRAEDVRHVDGAINAVKA
ncbi:hypothetical protein HAX54_042882, partial [Datura stramonium]|nr:hypothetical protein [Datura stramonium]